MSARKLSHVPEDLDRAWALVVEIAGAEPIGRPGSTETTADVTIRARDWQTAARAIVDGEEGTTRVSGPCPECGGSGVVVVRINEGDPRKVRCRVCKGTGGTA